MLVDKATIALLEAYTQMTVKPEGSLSFILRKIRFCPVLQTINITPPYLGGKSNLEEIPG